MTGPETGTGPNQPRRGQLRHGDGDVILQAQVHQIRDEHFGYDRYVVQGGGWGALITEQMALIAPEVVDPEGSVFTKQAGVV